MDFTHKQQQFIDAYVADANATKAAIAAGYSPKSAHAQGHRLLNDAEVRAEIERKRTAISKKVLGKYEVTRERIVEELAKLALSNMSDFTSFDAGGNPVLDFSDVNRDQMAAVREITSEVYTEGRGEDAQQVKRTKFSLYDKRAALMDLAKLEGHVVDRQQLSGPGGGPIQTMNAHVVSAADLSPEKRAMLRAALEGMEDDDAS